MTGITKLLESSTFILGVVVNVAHYLIAGAWSETLMELALGGYAVKEGAKYVGTGLGKKTEG